LLLFEFDRIPNKCVANEQDLIFIETIFHDMNRSRASRHAGIGCVFEKRIVHRTVS
jgi:hypothetical protein